jgi:hypothetical protein
MSTIKVDTYLTRGGASEIAIDKLKGVTAAGSMLVVGEGGTNTTNLQQGLTKQWVNLDGTGTIATRDSFNTGSITDNGTGDYSAAFTSAMGNTNYGNSGEGGTGGGGTSHMFLCGHSKATGSTRVTNLSDGGGAADRNIHCFITYGDLA